jgi:mannose-1-phosphate guanylyltransferase
MKTVILAGGRATRLYPLTLHLPKHLLMLSGRPLISYILEHCRKNGLKEFVICVSENVYEDFRNALGTGSSFGVRIKHSAGSQSLGTAGRILNARNLIGEEKHFIVYYGDIITSFDLRHLIKFHLKGFKKDSRLATIALSDASKLEFGVARTDEESRVVQFLEKPRISEISEYQANVGIGVFSRNILDLCKPHSDVFRDTIPKAIEDGFPVSGYPIKHEFFDVGTFASIDRLLNNLSKTRSSL